MIGRLGHYAILEKIGSGGVGDVYKARDTRLNRLVALKVSSHEKTSDPERKRRFIQEAQSASALDHPNIIVVHDINEDAGIDYIVMEFVEDQTLAAKIPIRGMRLSEALEIAIAIA